MSILKDISQIRVGHSKFELIPLNLNLGRFTSFQVNRFYSIDPRRGIQPSN